MEEKYKSLVKALINLYLDVKIRSNDELVQITDDQLDKERSGLQNADPLTIVGYIRSTVEILMNLKPDTSKSQGSLFPDSTPNQSGYSARDQENGYEAIIIKLEEEIRNHIRVAHTLKLHVESLQSSLEEIEKENKIIKEKYENTNQELEKLNNILALKDESIKKLLKEKREKEDQISNMQKNKFQSSKNDLSALLKCDPIIIRNSFPRITNNTNKINKINKMNRNLFDIKHFSFDENKKLRGTSLIPKIKSKKIPNLIPEISNLTNKFNRIINQIKMPINNRRDTLSQNSNINSLESSNIHTPLMIEAFKKELNDKFNEVSRLYSQLNHMRSQLVSIEEIRSIKVTSNANNNINLTTNFSHCNSAFLKRQKSSINFNFNFKCEDLQTTKKELAVTLKQPQKCKLSKNSNQKNHNYLCKNSKKSSFLKKFSEDLTSSRIQTRNLAFGPQHLSTFSLNFPENIPSNLNFNKMDTSNTLLQVIEKKINQLDKIKQNIPKK